jgi:hypothetical protein
MVGDESTPSYTEETIVHGGSQSMPLFYDNSVLLYSEVEMTLTYPRDWTEWNIDLQAFADQGVNLANVNTIALGLGNRNPDVSGVAGDSGTMYFDDIRLYPPPPEPAP